MARLRPPVRPARAARPGLRAVALGGLLLLLGSSASALPLALRLDPAQSALVAEDGTRAPLSGRVELELGEGPPLESGTTLDVATLAIEGGGLELALDERVPDAGAGLLQPGGRFEIPTLFLTVHRGGEPSALTLLDVAGSIAPAGPCARPGLCLETSVEVETFGPEGVVTAEIVAAVPEPASGALVALGAALLAATRRGAPGRVR